METGMLRLISARGKNPRQVVKPLVLVAPLAGMAPLSLPSIDPYGIWSVRWRIEFCIGNTLPDALWSSVEDLYQQRIIDQAFFASSDGPGYRAIYELRRPWWAFLYPSTKKEIASS